MEFLAIAHNPNFYAVDFSDSDKIRVWKNLWDSLPPPRFWGIKGEEIEDTGEE